MQDERVKVLLQDKRVLPPISKRKKYTTSRLVVQPDGTTVPVLRLVALEKYGPWKEIEHEPIWIDGNWENESWDNVALMERPAEASSGRNKYGVPAGTPEYYRRYRAANKDKVAAAQKRYNDRKRDALRELRRRAQDQTDIQTDTGPSVLEAEGMELLDDLQGGPKRTKAPLI